MRSVLSLTALAASVAAVAVPGAVSYDGFKVVRVHAGDHLDQLNEVVSKLGLDTWQPASKATAFADIVVPPNQLDAFEKQTSAMNKATMHVDLGKSIAEEADYHIYAGEHHFSSVFDTRDRCVFDRGTLYTNMKVSLDCAMLVSTFALRPMCPPDEQLQSHRSRLPHPGLN
jgi:hypothetical protein